MTRIFQASYWTNWSSNKESTFGSITSFHCRHQQWYDSWCFYCNRRSSLAHVKNETIICCQKETIPNRSHFFSIIEEYLQQNISNAIHLLSINQAPIKLSTVMEIIEHTKKWKPSLTEPRLVADHAIHSKLLEVLPLHDNTVVRSMLNLSIEDFRTACPFISAIGKIFQDSGWSDLS